MARGLREHCFSSPGPLSTPATVLQLPRRSPPQCKSQDYLAPKFCPPQILQAVNAACASSHVSCCEGASVSRQDGGVVHSQGHGGQASK